MHTWSAAALRTLSALGFMSSILEAIVNVQSKVSFFQITAKRQRREDANCAPNELKNEG